MSVQASSRPRDVPPAPQNMSAAMMVCLRANEFLFLFSFAQLEQRRHGGLSLCGIAIVHGIAEIPAGKFRTQADASHLDGFVKHGTQSCERVIDHFALPGGLSN